MKRILKKEEEDTNKEAEMTKGDGENILPPTKDMGADKMGQRIDKDQGQSSMKRDIE